MYCHNYPPTDLRFWFKKVDYHGMTCFACLYVKIFKGCLQNPLKAKK